MTPSEQFKLGFLTRCVEEGLSDTEVDLRVKQANLWTTMVANSSWNPLTWGPNGQTAVGMLGTGAALAAPAVSPEAMALAAAVVAGGVGALGYGLGRRAGYENKRQQLQTAIEPKKEQQHELVDAYDQHGKLMEAEMLRNDKPVRPRIRSVY